VRAIPDDARSVRVEWKTPGRAEQQVKAERTSAITDERRVVGLHHEDEHQHGVEARIATMPLADRVGAEGRAHRALREHLDRGGRSAARARCQVGGLAE